MSDEQINVAAVCGSEVRIYSDLPKGAKVRDLLKVMHFPHYGAAKLFAEEYEDGQRSGKPKGAR